MQRSLPLSLAAQLSTGCYKPGEGVLAALSQKSNGFRWSLSLRGTVQLLGQSCCAGCERRAGLCSTRGLCCHTRWGHRDGWGLRVWLLSPQCQPARYPWGWGQGQGPSIRAGDISQPAWLCSASLHVLCPDVAQVNLSCVLPVPCLECCGVWGSHRRSGRYGDSRCGWGGTRRGVSTAFAVWPNQSEPATLQLSRPVSWPGARVALGMVLWQRFCQAGAGGWHLSGSTWVAAPKTWEGCVGYLQRGSLSWNLPLGQFVFFQNKCVGYNQSGFIAVRTACVWYHI